MRPLKASPHRLLCLAIGLASAWTPACAEGLWFTAQGATPAARQAVEILAGAADDGLEAQDYQLDQLREQIRQQPQQPLSENEIARREQALSAALQRYLVDLRFGRVDPRQLGAKYTRPDTPAETRTDPPADTGGETAPLSAELAAAPLTPQALASGLPAAAAAGRLAELAHSAAPQLPQYASLRQALQRYRELAADPAWLSPLPPLPGGRLAPGQAYAGLALLTQRLIALGDLPAASAAPPRYENPLVEAVKSFQARHGLSADGVIGKACFEQLQVTPAARVRQIELALERWRWTPLPPARRAIVVNVPEFMLHTLRADGQESGPPMKVIVGKAAKTRTPLFDAPMRHIEFSPYWNVPPSITRGETLPRLRRDPAYLKRQGFELVAGDGRVIAGLPAGSLDALARGQLRIRQRPGASNALGDIKFVFPNPDNIYLHHTSSPALFARERRDFSHGCIRVEAPVELAKFVLAEMPEWNEQRIVAAMQKGKSSTLRLQENVPVIIAYHTAAVSGGRVHFFPDLYGLDRELAGALRKRSGQLRAEASQPAAINLESAD